MVRLPNLPAIAATTVAWFFASAADGADKEPLPTPPPMARPQTVSVYTGGPTRIQLTVGGRIVEPLRFLIRMPPERGQLGELRRTGRNTAVVDYFPPDSPGEDSFTFAAQSLDSPVSAPAKVRILVGDAPVRLEFEREMDFGNVYLGSSAVRDLMVRNAGGGIATGKVQTAPPWSVSGPTEYRVPKGWDVGIGVEFRPTEDREFAGQISLGPGRELTITVRGTGVMPLSWEPAHVVVEPEAREKGEVEFRVKNLTDAERFVEFEWPQGVSGPKGVEVPAAGERSVKLRVEPTNPQAFDGVFLLRSEGFERNVPLRIFPGPGRLAAEPEAFELGEIPFGKNETKRLVLRNVGIGDAACKVAMPASVTVVPDPAGLILGPGEERAFEVTYQGLSSGPIRDQLVFAFPPDRELKIPFRGNVLPTATPGSASARESLPMPDVTAVPPNPGSPGLQPPSAVFAEQRTPNSILLSWEVAPEAARYRIEFRRVGPLERGKIRSEWVEFPGVRIDVGETTAYAAFTGLASGYTWTVRVVPVAENGSEGVPSAAFQMSTLPAVRFELPVWVYLIAAAGGLVLWFVLWKRRREAEAALHHERISHLDKP